MPWEYDRPLGLSQVAGFYADYLEVYAELTMAGQYPYNDSFTGRIAEIAGPDEHWAIYLLQSLRAQNKMEITVASHRESGWRDVAPDELAAGPVRYAGIAEYGYGNVGGLSGFRTWQSSRLTRHGTMVIVLPGRNRSNGHLVTGRLLVKDKS